MISKEFISINEDLRNQESVIETLTKRLFLAGKCSCPKTLADEIWAREEVFSTALPFNFAYLHAVSDNVCDSTISFCRLSNPIMWGKDEVEIIILLSLNRVDLDKTQMRIVSSLARSLMDENFREQLLIANSVPDIELIMKQHLALDKKDKSRLQL